VSEPLTVGSLFAGVGGFDLGLERAGMKVVWQSEIDPYASAVLRKHWPDVPNLGDIRDVSSVPPVDVICGGWPCQTFSSAARGRNNHPDMWPEFLRIVRLARPRWVIAENVPESLHGFDRIQGDLLAAGYVCDALEVDTALPERQRARRRAVYLAHAYRDGESLRAFYEEAPGLCAAPIGASDPYPGAVGMADGLPARLDRLRCLGNAVSPQIAEVIGRAIVSVAA